MRKGDFVPAVIFDHVRNCDGEINLTFDEFDNAAYMDEYGYMRTVRNGDYEIIYWKEGPL